jgi:hypothetical protein
VETVDENCDGPMTVRVHSGGLLSVGDPNDYATGIFRITEDNALIINNGGTLRIHDHSTVIIERGATLRLNQGFTIELLGDDAVLEILGDFETEVGLAFTGEGFIRMGLPWTLPGVADGNVRLLGTGPHHFFLVGNGPQDKVLEIMPHTHLSPGVGGQLDQFTLSQCKVVLGADAYLNPRDADLSFNHVTFAALPGQGFRTIYGHGQSNHYLRHLSISGAEVGFTWNGQWGGQAPLDMRYSEIHDCLYGVQTTGSGATFRDVHLHDNMIGWKSEWGSGNSRVTASEIHDQTTFTSPGTGIQVLGGGNVHLEDTRIHHNQEIGVQLLIGGTLTASACTEIDHHLSETGFGLGIFLGRLGLSAQTGLYAHDNPLNIRLDYAKIPLLYQGENHLRPELGPYASATRAIAGTIYYPNFAVSSSNATNNYWNNRTPSPTPAPGTPHPGVAPVAGIDYDLANAVGGSSISLIAPPCCTRAVAFKVAAATPTASPLVRAAPRLAPRISTRYASTKRSIIA